MIFLGNLLDGRRHLISIPIEKKQKALRLLNDFSGKKKATVKSLQVLTGYLNFLSRAIFAGRAFTRRIYAKYTGAKHRNLKQYHHVSLDREFKFDLDVWRLFLENHHVSAICRPMVDLSQSVSAVELGLASDASGAKTLGFGAIFGTKWLGAQWEPGYIKQENSEPSIAYLELYALTAAILTWGESIHDCRVVFHCDNSSVVEMVNQTTSACKNCMYLIRLLVLNGLIWNRRIQAQYIKTQENELPDALSRLQYNRFRRLGPLMDEYLTPIATAVWPASRIWQS